MKYIATDFVSTVVQVNSSSGFIRYELNSNEFIYFDKSAFVSEDSKSVTDLTKVLKFGSTVKCNVTEASKGNCKYVAVKVWLCKESEIPQNKIHKHTEQKIETTEIDPDKGKTYIEGVGKLVCIIKGGVGFINKDQNLNKDPNNIYFTNTVLKLPDGSKFCGDIEKYLHVGDEVSYKAKPTKQGFSCKWRALEVCKVSSDGIVVPKDVESTMLYNRRGTVATIFPSKGVINIDNRGSKEGVFFEITRFYENGERVNNLFSHLKTGDTVMLDCYKDVPTKTTQWKASLVWTGTKPDPTQNMEETQTEITVNENHLAEKSNADFSSPFSKPVYNACDDYNQEIYYSDNEDNEILIDFSNKHDSKSKPVPLSENGIDKENDSVSTSLDSENWEDELDESPKLSFENTESSESIINKQVSLKETFAKVTQTKGSSCKQGHVTECLGKVKQYSDLEDWEADLNNFPALSSDDKIENPSSIYSSSVQELEHSFNGNRELHSSDISVNRNTLSNEISMQSHAYLGNNALFNGKKVESFGTADTSFKSDAINISFPNNQHSLNPEATSFSLDLNNKKFPEYNCFSDKQTTLNVGSLSGVIAASQNSQQDIIKDLLVSKTLPHLSGQSHQVTVSPMLEEIQLQESELLSVLTSKKHVNSEMPKRATEGNTLLGIQNLLSNQNYSAQLDSFPFQQTDESKLKQTYFNGFSNRCDQLALPLKAAVSRPQNFTESSTTGAQIYNDPLTQVKSRSHITHFDINNTASQLYTAPESSLKQFQNAISQPQIKASPMIQSRAFMSSMGPQTTTSIQMRPQVPTASLFGSKNIFSMEGASKLNTDYINSQQHPVVPNSNIQLPYTQRQGYLNPITRPQKQAVSTMSAQQNQDTFFKHHLSLSYNQPNAEQLTRSYSMMPTNLESQEHLNKINQNNTSALNESQSNCVLEMEPKLSNFDQMMMTNWLKQLKNERSPLLSLLMRMSTNEANKRKETCHMMHSLSNLQEYKELVTKCEQSWIAFMICQNQLTTFMKEKLVNNPCLCCQKKRED